MLNDGAGVTNKSIINYVDIENLSYQDCIQFFFDRPEYENGKEWFFQNDFEDPRNNFSSPFCNKALLVSYFSRVFQESEVLLKTFTEHQLCYGLQYIIDGNICTYKYYFFSEDVFVSDRINAISAMYEVFDKVFSKVCSNTPEPDNLGEVSYNRLCWMWWDMFSTAGMPQSQNTKLSGQTIIENLDKILLLDNLMCKKSALHGLGHLYSDYPEKVEEIITRHLNEIPVSLSAYASRAIRGDLQ